MSRASVPAARAASSEGSMSSRRSLLSRSLSLASRHPCSHEMAAAEIKTFKFTNIHASDDDDDDDSGRGPGGPPQLEGGGVPVAASVRP
eukprot:561571-Rhodomonas_salina.1